MKEKEIILKAEYSSLDDIEEFLNLLKNSGIDIVTIGTDEFVVKM